MRQNTVQPLNLDQDIKSGNIAQIYLISGEETFLVAETVKQLVEHLLEPTTRDFNFDVFDGTQADLREILSAVEVYPTMADRRVVLVNEPTFLSTSSSGKSENSTTDIPNPETAEDENQQTDSPLFTGKPAELSPVQTETTEEFSDLSPSEQFCSWLSEKLPESSVLILACRHKVDARSRIVKEISRQGKHLEFSINDRPTQNDPLFQRVVERLKQADKQISFGTYNIIRQRVGQDAHRVFQELEKAIAYIGEKKRIEEKDIRGLIAETINESIFALTDAIGRKNVSQALLSLHRLIRSGEAPIKVNALIARQVRLLLQARLLVEERLLQEDAGRSNYQMFNQRVFRPLAEKVGHRLPDNAQLNLLKQNPYAAYKIVQALRFFDQNELENSLAVVLQTDIDLKSSTLPAEQILEELVYDLCRRPNSRRRS